MKRYPVYKPSGVKWMGEIPEGWKLVPLWSTFRRVKRTDYADAELLSVYRDYGVVKKSSRDDNFNNPSDDLSQYQLVDFGDLVVNKMKAWQGSVAISEYRGIVSPAYFVFTPCHAQCSRFLHYLFRSAEYTFAYRLFSKGIRPNQWDLEPQEHSRLKVLLPAPSEQAAIAAFLDRETAKIDALVGEQERLIALLAEKRRAVISHAVTKGLDPNAPMKDSGIAWLGEVPAHWQIQSLKRLFSSVDYGISDALDGAGEVAILRMGNIFNGKVNLDDLKYVDDVPSNLILKAGDLLFNRTNSLDLVGKVGRFEGNADGPISFASYLVRLRTRNGVSSEFLAYLLNTPGMLGLVRSSAFVAIGQCNLNPTRYGEFQVAIPDVDEQKTIAAYLDSETAKVDSLTTEAERAISLLKERRAALISAAVTGKIDVRDAVAAEEVAA